MLVRLCIIAVAWFDSSRLVLLYHCGVGMSIVRSQPTYSLMRFTGFMVLLMLIPQHLIAVSGELSVTVVPRPESGSKEYVELRWQGDGALDVSGWKIEETLANPRTVHAFPDNSSLSSGEAFRLCQGSPDNAVLAPCTVNIGGNAVWNDGGDTLRLIDEAGVERLQISYTTAVAGELLEAVLPLAVSEPEPPPSTDDPPVEEPPPELDDEDPPAADEPEPEVSPEPILPAPIPPIEESPVPDRPDLVTICKATNSPRQPFVKMTIPLGSAIMRHGVNDADIIPALPYWTGRNTKTLYKMAGGGFTGEQILDRDCEVERFQARNFPRFNS